MKKCYFIGMSDIFDAEIIDTLKDKCEKIIDAEDLVEFWFFHGENFSYTGFCLCLATWLRTKYPEKVKAVTPGQACVLYLGEECLGCGFIDTVKNNEEYLWYLHN